MPKKKDWFRPKTYPHIGLPISYKDRGWVENYVTCSENIANHQFLPFIHKQISQRRFRKKTKRDGSRTKKRFKKIKPREIFYASHLDAQIYSYYADELRKKYEVILQDEGLENTVTAYRRIPVEDDDTDRNKCNIDFAKEVFDFIKNFEADKFCVLALDIEGFFDSLDHKILRRKWYESLGKHTLPEDHYRIYRSLVNYSFVNEHQLFQEFKDEILVRGQNGKLRKKRVKKKKYLYDENAVAFCKKNQFVKRIKNKGLIKSRKYENYKEPDQKLRTKGIPQGTPISDVLANLYMTEFDSKMQTEASKAGGLYRRYSDDMVIVCHMEDRYQFEELACNFIKDKLELNIKSSKTQIFEFSKDKDTLSCREYIKECEVWTEDTKFKYLGFSFDGEQVLLKSASIAKYYRKMKRSVKRAVHYAIYGKNADTTIFRKKLYKRFSYQGAGRRRKYTRDKDDPTKWHKSHHYDWGNFLSYVYLAANIFDEPAIKKQLGNHWKILNDEIKKGEKKIKEKLSEFSSK